ncbi:MAG TPA: DMT family transporter [Candidatus Limnocylindrales bacterium]|jgi:drug/metabolite transporter (DMT)-like permease
MPTNRPAWLGALTVLLAAALFGSLGVGSRFAYDAGLTPFAFVAWRAAVGALGLGLLVLASRRSGVGTVGAASAPTGTWAALALAIVLGAGVNLSIFLAFQRTTVALALLGFYTYPAMIAAGSALLGRERLDGIRAAALGLSLAGMGAVVLGGLGSTTAGRVDALGIALGLAGGACQATFVLTSGRYAAVRADVAIGVVLAGSAVIGAALTLAAEGAAALLLPFSSPYLLALLAAVGLLAAAVPSVLMLTGIRWVGGVRTGILMLFEPVVGVALAAALLAEGLSPIQVSGGATILLAAFLVQRGSRPTAEGVGAILPAPGGP